MLVDHTGERVEEMWLRFNGQTMQDDSTLTNCGIEEGAVIEMSLRLTSSPWWIPTLKNLEKPQRSAGFGIMCAPTDTVKFVKERIESFLEIFIEDQVLTFRNEILKNDVSLERKGIGHLAILVLVEHEDDCRCGCEWVQVLPHQ
ncbi:hypothetical protein BGZ99_008802 [Dissophora globulifera]|uniref:Ubiquitin-like domain-containing protein n=1 Tax=Dissophora globulifera TaxID=979702 RepID=A0A9P6RR76_9FUNG|nr:hypothetical protein BGZ99_008802 [Dissophora globulifera]